MGGKKLSDNQVNGLLQHMGNMLRDQHGMLFEAETAHGQTALETARKVSVVALAILEIQNIEEDKRDANRDPEP